MPWTLGTLAYDMRECTVRRSLAWIMDRSIIDSLQRVLSRDIAAPEDIRHDLWSCLDLAPVGDEDALDLAFILEKMELPAALDEFQRTLSQICARKPPR